MFWMEYLKTSFPFTACSFISKHHTFEFEKRILCMRMRIIILLQISMNVCTAHVPRANYASIIWEATNASVLHVHMVIDSAKGKLKLVLKEASIYVHQKHRACAFIMKRLMLLTAIPNLCMSGHPFAIILSAVEISYRAYHSSQYDVNFAFPFLPSFESFPVDVLHLQSTHFICVNVKEGLK